MLVTCGTFSSRDKGSDKELTVELAPLRPVRHKMGDEYVKAYFEHFPVSEPEDDQNDRNALYCL